jgi:hypothetical protein
VSDDPNDDVFGQLRRLASKPEEGSTDQSALEGGPGDSDKNFYVAVAIYTGAIATGLFLLGENGFFTTSWWYGAIYVVGGGVGVMSITPLLRPKLSPLRSPRSLWAATIVTWLFLAANLGFAVYDHIWPAQRAETTANPAPISPERWPALTKTEATAFAARVRFVPPQSIVVACETINCRDLADGIAEILLKTPGWKVEILHRGGMDITGVSGIHLNPSEPATETLRDALEATTSVKVTVGPDTRKDMGTESRIFLTVGSRPF